MSKPAMEFQSKISGVKLSAWEGERGLSWQLKKSYKDKNSGEWKETKYLNDWDLDALVSLIGQAKEFISARRRQAKEEAPGAARPAFATPGRIDTSVDDIPF